MYVHTKGLFTKGKLKAYNYFYNGYVQTVCYFTFLEILVAKVNPSQLRTAVRPGLSSKMDQLRQHIAHAWLDKSTNLHNIVSITVFSMGQVAALPFKVKAACMLGYTNSSRTSLPCKQNQNFKTEVWLQYFSVC